jgi:hypothetical protein
LLIEDYFQQIREAIDASPVVRLSRVAYDKRGTHEGFIRGDLDFADGSLLHIREFVDVETTIDRLVYAYQYMDAGKQFVFRYDNSGHHQKLNLLTHPHHKHDGSESHIVASAAPILADVLKEVENLVVLP